ncbi:MAG TPA: excinuclease ABC subunit UvrC [Spirochaetota bacterium]|mgnify:CR=1 FL=1|nr:excinuclease ABC subunit UvrC [Spirochaetota bacterium]HPN82617.1 excinuclease ABC subunit UvrC [Spirochaetota bacterium]
MNEALPLDERVRTLPDLPGVYLMKNSDGTIIYIGKARRLKRRVASYFNKNHDSAKTQALVRQIASIDYIVAGSESEALLIEANLIKEHTPRYNIQLRDSKRYPWLAVSIGEDFPRFFKTRNPGDTGLRTFGPWPNVSVIRNTITLLHRLFGFRYCRKRLVEGTHEPPVCFYYHIKRCPGPCDGHISRADYRAGIERAILFLEGRHDDLRVMLEEQMRAHARALEFEKAAAIRDQLAAIAEAGTVQAVHRVLEEGALADLDIAAMAEHSGMAAFAVMEIRGGKLLAQHLFLENEADSKPELFFQFLCAWIQANPRQAESHPLLLFKEGSVDEEHIQERTLMGRPLLPAQEADPGLRRLLAQAGSNAALALEEQISRRLYADGLTDLQRILALPGLPRNIEAFDIANTAGEANVAACIHFTDGRPDKKLYRKFIIRSVDGQDDFSSMREAVGRRYQRLANEGATLPDLVLIDGGKGQLSAAMEALQSLGLERIPLAALAKKEELIYLPGTGEPVRLDHHHFALRLLQSARDEVHRYVNSFHEQKRGTPRRRSQLEDIPGIGPVLRKKLLTRFGSIDRVRQASLEELADTLGSTARAEAIRHHLETRIDPKD